MDFLTLVAYICRNHRIKNILTSLILIQDSTQGTYGDKKIVLNPSLSTVHVKNFGASSKILRAFLSFFFLSSYFVLKQTRMFECVFLLETSSRLLEFFIIVFCSLVFQLSRRTEVPTKLARTACSNLSHMAACHRPNKLRR